MKRLTYNEVLNKCRKRHGDRYIYPIDMLERITDGKVPIVCPKHGEFWQVLGNHYKGCGCPKCGGNYKRSNDEFKEILSKKIKNENISFETIEYKNNSTPIVLNCKKHGKFKILPTSIKEVSAVCPSCIKEELRLKKCRTTEWFITKAKEIHGDKYDYSNANYVDGKTKLCIIHPTHGEFWQYPYVHLKGHGCVAERKDNSHFNKENKTSDFVAKAREKHGETYDYSKTEYVNPKAKLCIICKKHGEFWQNPYAHLNGQGCPKCGREKLRTQFQLSKEDFIKKSKTIHGDKYDYSKVEYINYNTKVCIVCPKHGEFWQTPICHFKTRDCPACKGELSTSKEEKEFSDFIKKTYNGVVLLNDRKQIAPMELDVFLPFESVAFEFDGLYWHNSEKIDKTYHLKKTELCEQKNIRLFHIFEDEWLNKRPIVENLIKGVFNMYDQVVNAEECFISEISPKETHLFLKENCLEGFSKTNFNFGLTKDNNIVSMMCFRKFKKEKSYLLTHYVNKLNVQVVGSCEKLLNHFIDSVSPIEITVNCNRRLEDGNIYNYFGFLFEGYSKPHKYYIKNGTRSKMSKDTKCRKIYDCGNAIFVWKKKKNWQ